MTTPPQPATATSAVAGDADVPIGTAYLVCFGSPGLHVTGNRYARHYIGFFADWELRGMVSIEHTLRTFSAAYGPPLIRAARQASLQVELVRTWPDVSHTFMQSLRRRNESPRLCPVCSK